MAFNTDKEKDFEISSLVVALDHDYKQSEISGLIECMKQFKQVLDVTAKKVTVADYTARQRERKRLKDILERVVEEDK